MNLHQSKQPFFRSSKEKKTKKPILETRRNDSCSLSSRSDIAKNSARAKSKLKIQKQKNLLLSKKEKQIRESIQYRYQKSKMRGYLVQFSDLNKNEKKKSPRNRSSEMDMFKQMRMLKVVNLKQFHQNKDRKTVEQKARNIKNLLKIRAKSGFAIKTEGCQKSLESFRFLKPYLEPQTPKKPQSKMKMDPEMTRSGDDWRFISMQIKQKSRNNIKQSKSRQIKVSSHRTLTVEKDDKIKVKTAQSQWDFAPIKTKLKFNKKYHI